MQTLHYAPYRNSDGTTTKKEAQARKLLGLDWLIALQSEDSVIQIMDENLSADYTLFCNVSLPNLPHDTDLILVSPKGIWVFEFYYTQGHYKADGDHWAIYDYRTRKIKRCKPNPIQQALANAEALRQLLESRLQLEGIKTPWVSPAVVLLNPKITTQVSDTVMISILQGNQVYEVITRDLKKFEDTVSAEEAAIVNGILKETAQTAEAVRPQKKIFTRRAKAYRGMRPQQWLIIVPIALMVGLITLIIFGYLAYDNRTYLTPLLTSWWLQLRLLVGR